MTPRMLPRVLSAFGAASRKEAEQAVHDGRVAVDGRVVRDVLRRVDPDLQVITLDGRPIREAERTWLMLNKRRGVVTTTVDPEGRPTVMDGLGEWAGIPGIAPVGRLDMDSGGLLLLTNDHALAARLLDPAHHVAKVYRVKVRGHPGEDALGRLRAGPWDEFQPVGRVEVVRTHTASTWLEIELAEGKNRQIRRMCDAVGHPVVELIRVRFGGIALGDLAPGGVRQLTRAQVAGLLPSGHRQRE